MSSDVVGVALLPILLLPGLVIFGVYVWSLIWCYGDAEKRGKPGCLVALLVALVSWPISLLVWIVFRPEPPGRYYE